MTFFFSLTIHLRHRNLRSVRISSSRQKDMFGDFSLLQLVLCFTSVVRPSSIVVCKLQLKSSILNKPNLKTTSIWIMLYGGFLYLGAKEAQNPLRGLDFNQASLLHGGTARSHVLPARVLLRTRCHGLLICELFGIIISFSLTRCRHWWFVDSSLKCPSLLVLQQKYRYMHPLALALGIHCVKSINVSIEDVKSFPLKPTGGQDFVTHI